MTRSSPYSNRSCLHRLRTWLGVIAGVSSMMIGRPATVSIALVSGSHSSSCSFPLRRRSVGMPAFGATRRRVSCSTVISRLKIAAVFPLRATLLAMVVNRVVFPTPGRAPTTIRSDRFRPPSRLSRSTRSVGTDRSVMPRDRSTTWSYKTEAARPM